MPITIPVAPFIGAPTNDEVLKTARLMVWNILLNIAHIQLAYQWHLYKLSTMMYPSLPSHPLSLSHYNFTVTALRLSGIVSAMSLLVLMGIMGEICRFSFNRRGENRRAINFFYKACMRTAFVANLVLCLVRMIAIHYERKVLVWMLSVVLVLILLIEVCWRGWFLLRWMKRLIPSAPLIRPHGPPTNNEIVENAMGMSKKVFLQVLDILDAFPNYSYPPTKMLPQPLSLSGYTFTELLCMASDLVCLGSLLVFVLIVCEITFSLTRNSRRPVNKYYKAFMPWIFRMNWILYLFRWVALFLKHGVFMWMPMIALCSAAIF